MGAYIDLMEERTLREHEAGPAPHCGLQLVGKQQRDPQIVPVYSPMADEIRRGMLHRQVESILQAGSPHGPHTYACLKAVAWAARAAGVKESLVQAAEKVVAQKRTAAHSHT